MEIKMDIRMFTDDDYRLNYLSAQILGMKYTISKLQKEDKK